MKQILPLLILFPTTALATPLQLPFPCGVTHTVTLGHNTGTHTGLSEFAWDFDHAVGDVVVAAAAGTVVMMKMDSASHCDTSACAEDGNRIVIDHGDGTHALYLHLRAGSERVAIGDHVEPGDELATVGLSGRLTGAHLHFQVQQAGSTWLGQSLPVVFEGAGDPTAPSALTSANCPSHDVDIIVDNLSEGFSRNNGYFAVTTGSGYADHFFWTYSNGTNVDSVGEWRANLPLPGLYRVSAYIPRDAISPSLRAPFEIFHVGGTSRVTQDQGVRGGFFGSLGVYKFAAGDNVRVRLRDNSGEASGARRIAFDAVRFSLLEEAGTTPPLGQCTRDNDCQGALACVQGACASLSTSSSMEPPSSSASTDSSSTSTAVSPPPKEEARGCAHHTTGGAPWSALLLLVALRRARSSSWVAQPAAHPQRDGA